MARSEKHIDNAGEYLCGRNAVREALSEDPQRIVKVVLSNTVSPPFAAEIRALSREAKIPVQTVPPQRLKRLLPDTNHQGVAVVLSSVSYLSVHDLLTQAGSVLDEVRERKPMILILDHIQDPYNFGAILRSAVGAGVAGVIIPDRDAAPVNATVLKTSAGTATRIPIARTHNLARVLEEMKERGYWIVGATGDGETSIWEMDWDRPLGIVIGSEEKGMPSSVAGHCDHTVSIPLGGRIESLNASVAAGIILFSAAKVR